MSNLESIVPPLELCKRIPAGKFAESVLVWEEDSCVFGKLPPHVVPRVENTYHTILAPAPTLPEIMAELTEVMIDYEYLDVCAYMTSERGNWGVQIMSVGRCANNAEIDKNPAAAALRLWFDVEGVK